MRLRLHTFLPNLHSWKHCLQNGVRVEGNEQLRREPLDQHGLVVGKRLDDWIQTELGDHRLRVGRAFVQYCENT